MHVIALEDEPTSLRGGQQLNLFEICHELAQRGHQISLIYGREGNLLGQYRQFCDRTIQIPRYGFDRRKISEVFGFVPHLAKIPAISADRDSVIFSNSCHPAFFAYLISLYHKLPLVCYIQSPSMDFNRQKLVGLKGVKRFITVSQQLKRYWMNLGYEDSNIDVVHNGTSLEKFHPISNLLDLRQRCGIPEDTKVISYTGRLDPEKGVDVLFKAFALLLEHNSNIRLLVAGGSVLSTNLSGKARLEIGKDYQSFLRRLSADLGIEKHVSFLGYLEDTTAIYQLSDVTVVPSTWEEPFGRVVIESMACGTPVVASRVGGIPEILSGEFEDYLVEPNDHLGLADKLQQVMNWREQNSQLGDRCRSHVLHQFSLEKMVDGIEKVIFKVVINE